MSPKAPPRTFLLRRLHPNAFTVRLQTVVVKAMTPPSVIVVPENDTSNKHSPYHGSVRRPPSKRWSSHRHNHDRETDDRGRAFRKPVATTSATTSRYTRRKCRRWWVLLSAVGGFVVMQQVIISSRRVRAFLGIAENLMDDGDNRKRNSYRETSSRVPPRPLSPTDVEGRERIKGTLHSRKSDENLARDSRMHMDVVELVTTGGGLLESRDNKKVRRLRLAKPTSTQFPR